MENKYSIPVEKRIKRNKASWSFYKSHFRKALLLGGLCFFIVLSLQNDFLFLDQLLLAGGIVFVLLIGAMLAKNENS
ncbi:MAG: hypothetical protein AAFU57_10520 [Bacteroidota bacterium]